MALKQRVIMNVADVEGQSASMTFNCFEVRLKGNDN